MATLNSIIKSIKLGVLENIYTRKVVINLDTAIISFTFDDVPLSAATNGAKILEKYHATGTFYVARGMENVSDVRTRRFINDDDIKELHNAGHNIGCHTYNHLNQRHHASLKVAKDCCNNTNELKEILNILTVDHFAYPFGMVSPTGKKALRHKYKTLRTTDYGLNTGSTDMTHLRAVKLYSNAFDKDALKKIIKLAIENKAWLIFYTHDVCDVPSEWGVTIEDFKWIVEHCVESGSEILNVNNAYDKIINSESFE